MRSSKLLISGLALVVSLGVAVSGLDAQSTISNFQKIVASDTVTSAGVVSVTGNTGLGPAGAGFQFASFGSPHIGRIFFGDGTGYRMHFSTRTGGVTTDRFSMYDSGLFEAGTVRVDDGSVSAPALAFKSATNTGLYLAASQIRVAVNGINGAAFGVGGTQGALETYTPATSGAAAYGAGIRTGRNQGGGGAAGFLALERRDGVTSYVYAGDSSLIRVATLAPAESGSHASGTVVGDQTSTAESKHLLGLASTRDMLNAVLKTRVHQFKYRDGRYGGETFTGIVTDESPWFGKDRDASHPQGKALNEINGLGYTVGAIQALHADTVKFRDDQLKLTRLLAEEQTAAARMTREAIQHFLERSNDLERRLSALEGRRR